MKTGIACQADRHSSKGFKRLQDVQPPFRRPSIASPLTTTGEEELLEKMKNNCFATTLYNKFTKLDPNQTLSFSLPSFSAQILAQQAMRTKRRDVVVLKKQPINNNDYHFSK
jgi:hypothetical protein